jgi:hypothetical protein
LKDVVDKDDVKKLIKIDTDAESENSVLTAFSPRDNPLSQRDVLTGTAPDDVRDCTT